jgi:hypothetical protein
MFFRSKKVKCCSAYITEKEYLTLNLNSCIIMDCKINNKYIDMSMANPFFYGYTKDDKRKIDYLIAFIKRGEGRYTLEMTIKLQDSSVFFLRI